MKWITAQVVAIALALAMPAAHAQEVHFTVDEVLPLENKEVPYLLEVTLRVASPTRVGVDAVLDLRDLQAMLEDDLSEEVLVDVCGNRTVLDDVEVKTLDDVVALKGQLQSQLFECRRTGEVGWQREGEKDRLALGFSARASAAVVDNCAVFELVDLSLEPQGRDGPSEEDEDLQAARILLLEAVNVLLRRRPLCPELPPELASLDPAYDAGGPTELGDGGLGVYLVGSIDVSTTTIVGILGALQSKGILPGPP